MSVAFRVCWVLLFVTVSWAQYDGLLAPTCQGNNILPNSVIQPGYCPTIWASGLSGPRSLEVALNGDVLTIESDTGTVTVLWDANNDGQSSSSERAILAQNIGLNHAVRINGNFVYASNATHVLRWKYTAGDRSSLGVGEIVVKNIPCCHHVTRSLAFDQNNLLYVQVGSSSNLDKTSLNARINRFDLTSIPSGGIVWETGFVYADGLRNEVGIRFDQKWQLWGVENGVDNENRDDLGGDIHNENPAEELNFLGKPGLFYGYPYCWTAKNVTGYPAGTQFYQGEFSKYVTDAWCQNTTNVVPPSLSMDAHMAPMDILFWQGTSWSGIQKGDAFVSQHGSWNRNPPLGYRLDHISFNADGFPASSTTFLGYQGPGAYSPTKWIRPVGLAVTSKNVLLLSSDSTGQIIAISSN